MIIKSKKSEILFYLSYIILYISLFIGDIYNIGNMDILARYLRICSYILIFISCINLRLGRKEFLLMIIFLTVINCVIPQIQYRQNSRKAVAQN